MNYTISQISSTVRDFEGAYGPMKNYKLKFKEMGDEVVELAQKAETPAPKIGDVLEGTIDMSGSHGPKFKKAYAPKAGASRRDDSAIKAQWAIKTAVMWLTSIQGGEGNLEDIQPLAVDFFVMVDKVKSESQKLAGEAETAPRDEFDQTPPEDF